MSRYPSRRDVLAALGSGALLGAAPAGAGATALGPAAGRGAAAAAPTMATAGATARSLEEAFRAFPAVDVHAHAFPALAPVTESIFLVELSLGAWMLDTYFPRIDGRSAYDVWKSASAEERARLDREHGIGRRFDDVVDQMAETVFVKYLVKEMARFLECRPTLADVIAARNEYTRGGYWTYVNDLFAAARIEALFIQGSIGAWTLPAIDLDEFGREVDAPIHRVATAGAFRLLGEDIPFDTLLDRYAAQLRREVRELGAVAFKSGIAKGVGADVQPWTYEQAEAAWNEYRRLPEETRLRARRRTLHLESDRIVQHYLLWHTCEVAWELGVPIHIHSGNGEGMDRLSSHYPYNLENVIRYPVEPPHKPVDIVMIHGGYPHVDEAAYLSHVFPNVWYDTSLMNPIANRGLHERMLTILETAPLSKVMFGSDAYHLPEFFYLAAVWQRRYAASSLAVLVDEGVLTTDEALRAGRMLMGDNALRLHGLRPPAGG